MKINLFPIHFMGLQRLSWLKFSICEYNKTFWIKPHIITILWKDIRKKSGQMFTFAAHQYWNGIATSKWSVSSMQKCRVWRYYTSIVCFIHPAPPTCQISIVNILWNSSPNHTCIATFLNSMCPLEVYSQYLACIHKIWLVFQQRNPMKRN